MSILNNPVLKDINADTDTFARPSKLIKDSFELTLANTESWASDRMFLLGNPCEIYFMTSTAAIWDVSIEVLGNLPNLSVLETVALNVERLNTGTGGSPTFYIFKASSPLFKQRALCRLRITSNSSNPHILREVFAVPTQFNSFNDTDDRVLIKKIFDVRGIPFNSNNVLANPNKTLQIGRTTILQGANVIPVRVNEFPHIDVLFANKTDALMEFSIRIAPSLFSENDSYGSGVFRNEIITRQVAGGDQIWLRSVNEPELNRVFAFTCNIKPASVDPTTGTYDVVVLGSKI
jgi:hypothetical protein